MAKRKRDQSEEDGEYNPGKSSRQSSKRGSKLIRDTNPNSLVTHEKEQSTRHSKSIHIVSKPLPIRRALLKWYATVRDSRGMPWRKPYDPNLRIEERSQRAYEVWQTQVATVIPYYQAWMVKFPTIADLANSSIEQVNALWKGLGYYSRASRLLQGAQKVVKDYQGIFPGNSKDMEQNIPGVGRYSAGAIASIAYGERVPVLDGNVHRLFSRFLALHALPKSKSTLDILWAAATAMVEREDDTPSDNPHSPANATDYPGDINQALIELGSTICKVRDPNCSVCPLGSWCGAYNETEIPLGDIEDLCTLCEPLPEGQGGVTAFPMKVEKKKARAELDIVSIVEWRSQEFRKFLLVRRPDKGLLAGLYEFPATSNIPSSKLKAAMSELAHKQLLDVLEDSVASYKGKKSKQKEGDLSAGSKYQITSIKPVGDGGDEPPQIKRPFTTQKHDVEGQDGMSLNAFWTSITDVANANIGTGVGKIWNLALSTFEKDIDSI
ncbi:DNA glycosylase [Rhodocollybia butyracea]|uniref:Adenine DNA glycosylase n=1 Tax=Rhodocollybia butyracea TaxID=206335 RepID=A0A9P5PRW9_9AGAR|nr:DNA glycosylase [Rhodocollybia butyracea]